MKKKTLVIPLLLLLLSIGAGLGMTLSTTMYIPTLAIACGNSDNEIYNKVDAIKYADYVYDNDNNIVNTKFMASLYSSDTYLRATRLGLMLSCDYLEKSMKYNKDVYDFFKSSQDDYKIRKSFCAYLSAMYLSGQKQEAMSEFENYYKKQNLRYSVLCGEAESFLNYVYYDENNPDLFKNREWVVDFYRQNFEIRKELGMGTATEFSGKYDKLAWYDDTIDNCYKLQSFYLF